MNFNRTARATGAWYLGLAVTGILGLLVIDPLLFDASQPAATLAHLQSRPELAHLRVALELGVVLTQAMAALWFGKLFRQINPVAGAGIALFGMVNATALLIGTSLLAAAVTVAGDPSLAPGGDAAATVTLLHSLDSQIGRAAGVFFGLWLIPMGWVALTRGCFPRALGWVLVVGGVGYVSGAFIDLGLADAPSALVNGLPWLATVGEMWMLGYLLIKGIRPDTHPAVVARLSATANQGASS
jgi:hypothetical protein